VEETSARTELETALFGWDGVSFQAPRAWNLSVYQLKRTFTRIEFDDDYTIRLEAEWTRPKRDLDIKRIQKRYDKSARKLNQDAEDVRRIEELPEGWVAVLYTMPENERLLTAFHLSREPRLFCSMILHFGAEDKEDPEQVLRALAGRFRVHAGDVVPWSLYDLSLEIPAPFRLAHTDFQTGRKLLIFQWHMRRFFLWHISLAELILKRHPAHVWVTDLLNTCRVIRGPVFLHHPDGRVDWRRPFIHRLGHFDELSRWCFQYRVGYFHDKEADRLIAWAYSFRKKSDLKMLEAVRVGGAELAFGRGDVFAGGE
jgi:hypothetical protein